MKECEAIKKFRTVLKQFDLDEQVKGIDLCENKLAGAFGVVQPTVEYRISLDKLLLMDPEKLDSEWTDLMAQFPDSAALSLPKHDRIFLVFLHELGHIVNHHCLGASAREGSEEEFQQEEEAWDFVWTVYRAYRAGHEQTD